MLPATIIPLSDGSSSVVLRQKILIVGEACVGKSAIIKMLSQNIYAADYNMTTEISLSVHTITLPDSPNTSVEQFIFDLPGNALFHKGKQWLPSLCHDVDVAIFVCDPYESDQESIRACSRWLEDVKEYNNQKNTKETSIVVVRSKMDVMSDEKDVMVMNNRVKVVSNNEMSVHAKNEGYEYFECSALLNTGIKEIFSSIAKRYIDRYERLNEDKRCSEVQ